MKNKKLKDLPVGMTLQDKYGLGEYKHYRPLPDSVSIKQSEIDNAICNVYDIRRRLDKNILAQPLCQDFEDYTIADCFDDLLNSLGE